MRALLTMMILGCLNGCGGESAEPASAEASAESAGDEQASAESDEGVAEPAVATEPDLEKLKKHVAEHLKVPASRDEILAACAQTEEFTEGEKGWIAERLTDDNYETTDAVSQALGL